MSKNRSFKYKLGTMFCTLALVSTVAVGTFTPKSAQAGTAIVEHAVTGINHVIGGILRNGGARSAKKRVAKVLAKCRDVKFLWKGRYCGSAVQYISPGNSTYWTHKIRVGFKVRGSKVWRCRSNKNHICANIKFVEAKNCSGLNGNFLNKKFRGKNHGWICYSDEVYDIKKGGYVGEVNVSYNRKQFCRLSAFKKKRFCR